MAKKKTKKQAGINKEMSFADVLHKHPELANEFMQSGLHCMGCPMAMSESIEQGCIAHGIDSDKLIEKINKKIKKK